MVTKNSCIKSTGWITPFILNFILILLIGFNELTQITIISLPNQTVEKVSPLGHVRCCKRFLLKYFYLFLFPKNMPYVNLLILLILPVLPPSLYESIQSFPLSF